MSGQSILSLQDVTKDFIVKSSAFGKPLSVLRAVNGVSLNALAGETLGIVGESGCGKTTLGRLILRLLKPTSGRISFLEEDLAKLSTGQMRNLRRQMQVVFQDPYSSLNPRMRVHDIIGEPLENFGFSGDELRQRVRSVMEIVQLPIAYADRYPHAFSGGQRQRIGIARALALEPQLLVCDEAVSALDVSVQAQILNLLRDIQSQMDVTLIFISHNLGVIRFLCHRVAVMYLGRIVEFATEAELFESPLHPYTQALLSAIPETQTGHRKRRTTLKGDIPSPIDPPPGCPFHLRCPRAEERCKFEIPPLHDESGHAVACHFPG